MPGGAAAVVPRMPFRAAGAVAAAVLRIPGKGTKIFFAGKIRSRFSAGAVARTRPFTPDMSEFCRSWVASGRPIARRSPAPAPGSGPRSRLPTPDAVPCNAAPLCPAFPLCSAACSGAAAYARGRCGRMLFFAVCGRKRFILGEFGNFVTFAPNFKPKQQWHINYSKVRKA